MYICTLSAFIDACKTTVHVIQGHDHIFSTQEEVVVEPLYIVFPQGGGNHASAELPILFSS